ncbi:cell envelope integrity EipB family protein [Mesorhizobium xinjiangense]|uniref:cell envelope integrity EipB family protein n=1 Tax=Mesorhizobium xinjiangense TaxID=2678685 RepID=UPI0012EDF05F|nr:cell envelope integrity EipB family protein [Mesorhizobium xinjiangense]
MRAARLFCIASAATPLLAAIPALAQPLLVPHRAVYDIVLADATERSGITGINGRMVYEFNGSPCEGYTVSFRFVTRIETAEVSRVTDQQTTTYEDAEGKTFNFVTKSYVDQTLDREIRGKATRQKNKTMVELDEPEETDVQLAATQFPTQHLYELISKAEAGETFYETTLYDGSDEADEVMTTSVVIGKEREPMPGDAEFPTARTIKPETFWPVSIAYFDQVEESGEVVPDYRINFKLHENGITRDLTMDYGDFSMKGKLVDLAIFQDAEACKK